MLRWLDFKNGGDATTIAINISRAITGRQKIAFCGYHGSNDGLLHQQINVRYPFFNKKN